MVIHLPDDEHPINNLGLERLGIIIDKAEKYDIPLAQSYAAEIVKKLINAILITRYPIADAYLANEKGKIMYGFHAGFKNGLDLIEYTAADMNGDGWKGIGWILALGMIQNLPSTLDESPAYRYH